MSEFTGTITQQVNKFIDTTAEDSGIVSDGSIVTELNKAIASHGGTPVTSGNIAHATMALKDALDAEEEYEEIPDSGTT